MTRKMLAAAALAAGLVISGGVLYAQQQEREVGTDRMSWMGEMMAMMRSCPMTQKQMASPAAVLRHRETLELSDSQVEELGSLGEAARGRRGPSMEAMRQAHEDLAQASGDAGLDETRARDALDRMAEVHTEMSMGMLRERARVREILTPEQAEKLDELGPGTMEMMMRMMDGASMGGMHMRPDTTAPGSTGSGEDKPEDGRDASDAALQREIEALRARLAELEAGTLASRA